MLGMLSQATTSQIRPSHTASPPPISCSNLWDVAALEIEHLGSSHIWEVVSWENACVKIPKTIDLSLDTFFQKTENIKLFINKFN